MTMAPDTVREMLVDYFPKCFMPKGAWKLPLKVGIHADILAALPWVEENELRAAISDYCEGPKYLRQLKSGAVRVNLLGELAGEVTADEQAFAELMITRIVRRNISAKRRAQKARREAQPVAVEA